MALGDDALEGLDLSVLDNITVNPAESEAKVEDKNVEEEPSIFQPQLNILEVDELPEENKEEVKVEKPEEDGKAIEGEASAVEEKDTEEPVLEEEEESSEEEEGDALRVFAELQRDKGLIDYKDDEFEGSEEWLLQKVDETIDSKVQDYKDSMPAEVRYLLDNYEDGVPLNTLLNMQSQEQVYESITLENVEKSETLQKNLVKDLLLKSGWSEERANKKIQRYEDAGVLYEEAEEALSSLVDVQKQQKEQYVVKQKEEQKQRIQAHEQWLENLNDHISKKEEILPGFKLSPKDKDNLYKGITKLDKNGENEIMRLRKKDPEFDLKIAYLATVLKWDFSAFERQSTTKSTRKLAAAIKSTKKTGSRPSRGTSNNVDFSTMRKSLQ
jgi:hypothetical protein